MVIYPPSSRLAKLFGSEGYPFVRLAFRRVFVHKPIIFLIKGNLNRTRTEKSLTSAKLSKKRSIHEYHSIWEQSTIFASKQGKNLFLIYIIMYKTIRI